MELKNESGISIKLGKEARAFASFLKKLKDQKGFAALTQTKVIDTEFSGDYKLLIKTVTLGTASDVLTLVRATDKVTEIAGVFSVIKTGAGANFQSLQISYSGLVITIVSLNGAGNNATSWGDVDLFIVARGAK